MYIMQGFYLIFLFLNLQKKIVMSYNYDSRALLNNCFRFNYIFIFYQLVTFLSKNKSFERTQKMLFLSFLVNDQFTSQLIKLNVN